MNPFTISGLSSGQQRSLGLQLPLLRPNMCADHPSMMAAEQACRKRVLLTRSAWNGMVTLIGKRSSNMEQAAYVFNAAISKRFLDNKADMLEYLEVQVQAARRCPKAGRQGGLPADAGTLMHYFTRQQQQLPPLNAAAAAAQAAESAAPAAVARALDAAQSADKSFGKYPQGELQRALLPCDLDFQPLRSSSRLCIAAVSWQLSASCSEP